MILIHYIGTIAWGVAFAGLLTFTEITPYLRGYLTGAFFMLYYFAGLVLIEEHAPNNPTT